jgi:hypothetical protein
VIKLVLVALVVGVAAFSRRTVHTRGDDASGLIGFLALVAGIGALVWRGWNGRRAATA